MGLTPSLLDENKANFIKEWTKRELRNFASIYKKQYSLAFLSHVHDELVQRKQEHTRLLKQRDPPQEAEVVYQESVLCYYDNRKWKERFVVLRANYSLECHESYEAFMRGVLPLYKLSTTGGTILTTEEKYMEVVDRCFPDADNVKEDFAPPVVGMPGQFPVYLRLPYERDHYFCFLQEAKQAKFISVLSDCIRHQNQDFLKRKTYEVQAFIKAIQLYRQDNGYYESWDMLIGNDVQVLANLTMEELLPSIEKDMLLRLKAKKMEKKKIWFATIEAAYNLVQETLMEGMAALNEECIETAKQQSALMRSDMDQIMSSRVFLESKLRATVAELATEYCKQHVEPRLPAVLEEMMWPISMGFEEARQVSETMMEHLCQNYHESTTGEELQQALEEMSKPNLESCYEKVSRLRDYIQEFSYPNCRGLEHSTQIDIQRLVDSVSYTFGLLLKTSSQDYTSLSDAMVKVQQRVLKQYDYDSSTQRKNIFREALISITLPSVKAFLAPTFKKELPNFEQYIFDDYVHFINVENVYEDILQQILEVDVSKVVKEAANLKRYNLIMESRYRFSTSSSFSTPPGSPDYTSTFKKGHNALPSSPLLSHGLMESQSAGEDPVMAEKKMEQEVIVAQQEEVQAHAQPELRKLSPGEDAMVAEKMVEQEGLVQAHARPELIKVPNGEDAVVAEKMVEPEGIEVRIHAQPELIKISTSVNADKKHKVEEDEVQEGPGNAATEIRARSATPETLVVQETLVDTRSLEEKTYSPPPDVVAIYSETLVAPPSSSDTDPALTPAAHTLNESIPKPVEREANETPVQAGPPEGDTRSVDQVSQSESSSSLKFVSAESETDISTSSAEVTAPGVQSSSGVQALAEEERTGDATGDTQAVVDDLTSNGALIHEVRVSNVIRDFSDSSWTTEEEGDSTEEDDLTMETTSAIATPEDPLKVKCEAISDVNANVTDNSEDAGTEAARPLDCIREIRELVVEVIEVEEVVQHYPEHGEVSLNTQ